MSTSVRLLEAQSRYITFWHTLKKTGRHNIAAPFLSVSDPETLGGFRRPILLVGQATRGCWFLQNFDTENTSSISEQIEERCETTRDFVTNPAFARRRASAFWRLRRVLKEEIGAPVIWTNLVKIGVLKDNPNWTFVREQQELAKLTLRAEIEHYSPSVVLLVTYLFGRLEVVVPLFSVDQKAIERARNGYWSHLGNPGSPSLLWTRHPGRVRNEMLDSWVEEAVRLYQA